MKRASSLRFILPCPSGVSFAAVVAIFLPPRGRALGLGCPANRPDDVAIAGAAAESAGDRRADLLLGGIGLLVADRPRGHDHTRGAEAALQAVLLVASLLYGVELAPFLDRLDRAHVVPV